MSRLVIELSDPALHNIRAAAADEKLTVEEFIARNVERDFAEDTDWARRVERAKALPSGRIKDLLRDAPDVPPVPGDEIE